MREAARSGWILRLAGIAAALLAGGGRAPGGAAPTTPAPRGTQVFRRPHYPTFRTFELEDGRTIARLVQEIRAEQADNAENIEDGRQLVFLTNVAVVIYEDDPHIVLNTPAVQPLPKKLQITAKRGKYEKRPDPLGRELIEVLQLSEDVVVRRYAAPAHPMSPDAQPEELTEIRCDYAEWNNTSKTMEGRGRLVFTQKGSVLRGNEFIYTGADVETFSLDQNIRDWEGNFQVKGNVTMVISPQLLEGGGYTEVTNISCADRATFSPRDNTVEFVRDVVVRRDGQFTIRTGRDPAARMLLLLPREKSRDYQLSAENEVSIEGPLPEMGEGHAATTAATEATAAGKRFSAKSDRLFFNLGTRQLDLSMPVDAARGAPLPVARVGDDSIQDRHLTFLFETTPAADAAAASGTGNEKAKEKGKEDILPNRLAAVLGKGGDGEVIILRANQPPAAITYRGALDYRFALGVATFTEVASVRLGEKTAPVFTMEGADPAGAAGGGTIDTLHVHLTRFAELVEVAAPLHEAPPPSGPDASGRFIDPAAVLEAFAATPIVMVWGEWRAKANRISYNPSADQLVLQSLGEPGSWRPPVCEVDNAREQFLFTSPQFRLSRGRAAVPDGERPFELVGGPGANYCRFTVPEETDGAAGVAQGGEGVQRLGMDVTCDDRMWFSQERLLATFLGGDLPDSQGVRAVSNDPDDQYAIEGQWLELQLMPMPAPAPVDADANANTDKRRYQPRFIDVRGHLPIGRLARFDWRGDGESWSCAGVRIYYGHEHSEDPSLGAYVYIMDRMRDNGPPSPVPAEIRQEGGVHFVSDGISMSRYGHWVVAETRPDSGRTGRLELPGGESPLTVDFREKATYKVESPTKRQIIITGSVSLDWPVQRTRMDGELLQVDLEAVSPPAGPAGEAADLAGRLGRTHRLVSAAMVGTTENSRPPPDVAPPRVTVWHADAEGAQRQATADTAWLFMEGEAAYLDMLADAPRLVEMVDTATGLTLHAPRVRSWQQPPRFETLGGEGFVVLRSAPAPAPAPGAAAPPPRPPVVLRYARRLNFDETTGQLILEGEVTMAAEDESFLLAGDRMTATLTTSGEISDRDGDFVAGLRRVVAESEAGPGYWGQVILKTHPVPNPSMPGLRPEERPGGAWWIRAGRVEYDASRNMFEVSQRTRHGKKVQIIRQEIGLRPDGRGTEQPVRLRVFMDDRFRLFFGAGGLTPAAGSLKGAERIPPQEPLAFSEAQ